jgi:hypothetical protein
MTRIKIKTARFHMLLSEYLKEELKILAEKRGVSASEYVQDLIKEAVFKDKQK